MNLIEELGIEKARAIVAGAPDGANEYSVWASLSYYKTVGEFCQLWRPHYQWWNRVLYNSYMKQHRRSLGNLRTAIANHDLSVSNPNQNDKQADLSIKSDIEDHCTDICNHISPLTGVIER